jgi:hypothetical protein
VTFRGGRYFFAAGGIGAASGRRERAGGGRDLVLLRVHEELLSVRIGMQGRLAYGAGHAAAGQMSLSGEKPAGAGFCRG